jgi:hypothetical protein
MEPLKKEIVPIQNYFRFVRSLYGEDLLENFLVSAVASVLLIRLYLALMGYPQIGGGGLHLAHMLWGGLLMLAAIFMALGFLSRPAHEWAAVLGGIGFGAFIDEMGKFITNDNNYFFQPAIAIIYVTFILIYIAIRWVFNYRPLTPYEDLANAFELVKQGSVNGLNREDEQTVMNLLERCDPADPLAQHLREMLPHIRTVPSRQPYLLNRLKHRVDRFFQRVITRWWFAGAVIAFFAFTAITGFSLAAGPIIWPWTLILGIAAAGIILLALLQFWEGRVPNLQIPLSGGVIAFAILAVWAILINRENISLPFAEWAQFVSSSISAVLIVTGIVFMPRSRLTAYQMFQRAVLVSILLTMVFAFYEYQFYALIGVFVNILILAALRYMINREKVRVSVKAACPPAAVAAAMPEDESRSEPFPRT